MHHKESSASTSLSRLRRKHTLGIPSVQLRAAAYIDTHMHDAPDEAHRNDHNAQLFDDASIMFDRDPSIQTQVDVPRFVDYNLGHDLFRSSIRWLNPMTFVIGQYGEAYLAKGTAIKFFRRYGYGKNRLRDIGDVVAAHALSPTHAWSKALPHDKTRLFFNDLDNLAVLSNKRVKQMIRYLYRSFGKWPVQLALPALARNFERNTAGFTYNFDIIRDEAQIRRNKTLPFVQRLGNWGRPRKSKD